MDLFVGVASVGNVQNWSDGGLRTYKIYLGCGNILMAPNDEYLCIVPRQSAAALVGGKVFLPFEGTTPEHEHFLQVDREEADPVNVDERAWVRLKGRREFEREQETAPPPPPPEDYGIIEWDKEKCWW